MEKLIINDEKFGEVELAVADNGVVVAKEILKTYNRITKSKTILDFMETITNTLIIIKKIKQRKGDK